MTEPRNEITARITVYDQTNGRERHQDMTLDRDKIIMNDLEEWRRFRELLPVFGDSALNELIQGS